MYDPPGQEIYGFSEKVVTFGTMFLVVSLFGFLLYQLFIEIVKMVS